MLQKSRSILPLIVAAFALLAIPVLPAAADYDTQLEDETIEKVVENRLAKRNLEDEVDVSVEDGYVMLEGEVESRGLQHKVVRLTRGVDDVVEVQDRITVRDVAVSDEELAQKVAKNVRNDAFFGVFDWIEGRVENGTVILEGAVREAWKKDHFGEMAESIPGVRDVRNNLEILPASVTDDRIRASLAREIYGDISFYGQSFGAREPIHIIVDGGDVRLEGAVTNQVQKRIASSIARTNVLAFEVENNLRVD